MMNGRRDRGVVLPLVLTVTVVLGLVVVTTARYVSTDLRYASVVEDRTDARATAEGGVEYAVEQLRRGSLCLGTFPQLPAPTNGASLELSCAPVGSSLAGVDDWAVVITGESVASGDHLRVTEGGDKEIGGRMFMTDPSQMNITGGSPSPGAGGLALNEGDLFYDGTADDCATIYTANDGSPPLLPTELDERFFLTPDPATILPGQIVCLPDDGWTNVTDEPTIDLPLNTVDQTELDPSTPDYFEDNAYGCRIFEPGIYTAPIDWAASNYFRSGNYFFDSVALQIPAGSDVTVGYPANARYVEVLSDDAGDPICQEARLNDPDQDGATWYLGGTSYIELRNQTRLEMLPRAHVNSEGFDRFVSIHVLSSGPDASTLVGDESIVYVSPGSTAEAVFQGRVWAPYQRIDFENVSGGANGQLLGGVVVASLYGDSNPSTDGFKIQADTSPAEYRLRVDSTATKDDVSVTVRAIVEQRLDATDPAERAAINSLRVVP